MLKSFICFAVAFSFARFSLGDVIDLNGESRTVPDGELASSFTNTSDQAADLTIEVAEGNTVSFDGSISGNIRLVKIGKGTLGLTQANAFTGGVALQAGLINFTVAGSLGTGLVTITGGATLQLGAVVECANPIHLLAGSSYLQFGVNNKNAFLVEILQVRAALLSLLG